jgi:YggT family protein
MFVLANLFGALASILDVAINILWWLIIIRALISWVNPDPYNPIVRFLYTVTEPFLAPFRRIIPSWRMGIDISPILAILALMFVRFFVVRTLYDLSIMLR